MDQIFLWSVFAIFVAVSLLIDLFFFKSDDEGKISVGKAAKMSAFWISLSLLFCVGVAIFIEGEAWLTFLTAYIIELSLSVDNLFVFLLIFSYFKVPPISQRRALVWGILGAVIFRLIFIMAGIALISRFHWVIYIFGAFLVYTGIRLAFVDHASDDPSDNLILRLSRKWLPVSDGHEVDRFFVRVEGALKVTPLFIAVLMIETSDIIFAVDSIPAVLAISLDPFIIYTSNIFAILGLRSLYFALAGFMDRFHLLHYALAFILTSLGVKMLASAWYHPPIWLTFTVIGLTLTIGVLASVKFPKEP